MLPRVIPKVLLKTRLSNVELAKPVSDADYDLLVTGDASVYKPNGDRLCVVYRQAISPPNREVARKILRPLRSQQSRNRGMAAGGKAPLRILPDGSRAATHEAMPVPSAVIGYFDRYPRIPYCRQTAFNAHHAKAFEELTPTLLELASVFEAMVPERFQRQLWRAKSTSPDFVITGTPWTTITVNHNWQTHTHRDRGDLDEGFSCLTVLRSGNYAGGALVFPAFRVAVDLDDGDLIMMDSHEIHANTPFELSPDADHERISMVLYYRTKMLECGTAAQELDRAKHLHGDLAALQQAEEDQEAGLE